MIVMPGYKLVVFKDAIDSASITFDNTNGRNPKYFRQTSWFNAGSACRLYCRGVEVPEVSYG
jgi:hypothetical protein